MKLSSDGELDKWLNNENGRPLLDSDGDQVVGFETLVENTKWAYTMEATQC